MGSVAMSPGHHSRALCRGYRGAAGRARELRNKRPCEAAGQGAVFGETSDLMTGWLERAQTGKRRCPKRAGLGAAAGPMHTCPSSNI